MTISKLISTLQRINAPEEEVLISDENGETGGINEVRVTFDADGSVQSVVLW